MDFEEIYRGFVRPVYAFVAYRIDSRSDAEDVTATTFEKAWRASGRFDPAKGSVSTWIFTIARNCLNDHLRSQSRRPSTVELDEEQQDGVESDPVEQFQAQEMRRELRDALGSLSANEREVVALKFGGSLNNREIGRLLNITESNVGTILYRSLMKLKNQLEGGIEND